MANNCAAWQEFSKSNFNGSVLLNIVVVLVTELVVVVNDGVVVVEKFEWFANETFAVGCPLLWLLCNVRSSWFVVEVGGGNDKDVVDEAVAAKIGAVR